MTTGGNYYGVGDFLGDLIRDHNERQYVAQVDRAIGSLQEQAADWKARAEHYRLWECICRMILVSYDTALRQSDPDHPFVQGNYKFNDFIAQGERITAATGNDEEMRDRAGKHARDNYPSRVVGHTHAATLVRQALSKMEADHETLRRSAETLDSMRRDLADHRAERLAYRAALQAIDPEHPLLRSRDLRDRLRRGAHLAFDFEPEQERKWSAFDASVIEFMRTEVPPPVFTRASVQVDASRSKMLIDTLKTQVYGLESDLCDHRAQKVVFRSELARIAPGHPLITDNTLRQGISRAAGQAFAFAPNGNKYEALDSAALEYFQSRVGRSESLNSGSTFDVAGYRRAATDAQQTAAEAGDIHDLALRQQKQSAQAASAPAQSSSAGPAHR